MLTEYYKNSFIFQNKPVRRVELFYIVANLFKACLNRKQLDSHIYLCFQSAVLCGFS